MKRKLAWVCLLVSPLVIGGVVFCSCQSDDDRISKANCARIKKGMTMAEVEAILGREKDKLSQNDCWWGVDAFIWHGPRGTLEVQYNPRTPAFSVEGASFVPTSEPTFLEKVRNWLGM